MFVYVTMCFPSPHWSSGNLLHTEQSVSEAGRGGPKLWLLHLIQQGFWGMKHAQAINDFFLSSPALYSSLPCSLQSQDNAPDPNLLTLLTYKRGAIILREILG